ncbi:MAG: helix-turn-helix domain-containing protein [Oscillospiraceae bacterium]|nr:helix-turn-helix domain-containing protein [Oscillospiraceae bacterium]MBQ7341525.1 helix-turn-helix domain-containing protein [Oscillospiraceae bacterium]
MELGEKLRQARLEKGLSQKALCGDIITRNMLSQIENGSANPSMETLRLLAARLELPLSWFLEDVLSSNARLMVSLRNAPPRDVLDLLEEYHAPDDCFDAERYLIETLACLSLAEEVLEERPKYALTLLDQAQQAGEKTPYYTDALARQRAILCYRADPFQAGTVVKSLPSLDQELLLRAEAALQEQDAASCLAFLSAAARSDKWHLLKAQAHLALGEYEKAIEHFLPIEEAYPQEAWPGLEQCYRQLEDYKMAYHYACKGR